MRLTRTANILCFFLCLMLPFIGGCIFVKKCDIITKYEYRISSQPFSDAIAKITLDAPKDYKSTGKIYAYLNYLFVNEPYVGIHILDVSKPSNPQKKYFLNIPGNVDVAVKNNILYADMFTALVSIDISGMDNGLIKIVDTQSQVFDFYDIVRNYYNYLIEQKELKTQLDDNTNIYLGYSSFDNSSFLPLSFELKEVSYKSCNELYLSSPEVMATSSGSQTGQGGSLARFMLVDDYLYGIDNYHLNVVDISSSKMTLINRNVISWGIETLFLLKDKLFIGAQTGLYIYDVSNPKMPTYISEYNHMRSCDPVVVEGDYAYVTLRSNNQTCTGDVNQLEVIDIKDIYAPKQVSVLSQNNPYGLTVKDDVVVVCDGGVGLKIIDVSNKLNPIILQTIKGFDPRDIIHRGNVVYVVTTNDVIIFSASTLKLLKQEAIIDISL